MKAQIGMLQDGVVNEQNLVVKMEKELLTCVKDNIDQ